MKIHKFMSDKAVVVAGDGCEVILQKMWTTYQRVYKRQFCTNFHFQVMKQFYFFKTNLVH